MAVSLPNMCYFSVEEKACSKSGSLVDIFNWVNEIHLYISKFQSSLRSQFGFSGDNLLKKTQDLETTSPQKEISEDDEEICREDVEMVMGRMGICCDPREGKLRERWGSEEFSNLFGEEEPTMDELRGAFSVFDENGDGFIDAMELQRVLCVLGFIQGSGAVEECKKMISSYDEDGDERINFGEFGKLMERSFC